MPKKTVLDIYKKKAEGKKISMLTAYDYPTAQIVDQAGIDMILVGDSLGMVVQGVSSTLPVTMDEMLYHTKMVSRAAQSATQSPPAPESNSVVSPLRQAPPECASRVRSGIFSQTFRARSRPGPPQYDICR